MKMNFVIIIGFLIAVMIGAVCGDDLGIINITFSPVELTLKDGKTASVSYNISYQSALNLSLSVSVDYTKVGKLLNFSTPYLPATTGNGKNETEEVNGTFLFRGTRLGTTLVVFLFSTIDSKVTSTKRVEYWVNVLRVRGTLQEIFRYFIIVLVILITFLMCCAIEPDVMIAYVKKPIAPAIGLFSQFLLMPLLAFGLSYTINLGPEFSFGLLTVGCSPGGGGSNMWTVLLEGDINLSMTMTFLSQIAALAMMPLWIFLLGRFFIDPQHVTIPYAMIAVNLLQLALPAVAAIILRHFKPEWAKKLTKLTPIFAIFFIVFLLTFGVYVNLYMYQLIGDYPIALPSGILLPWVGFLGGFVVAKICRLKTPQAKTVAIETGIQNIGIAMLILLYSMPQPQGDLGGIMPIIVALFTPTPLYFFYLGLVMKRRCCYKGSVEDVQLEADNQIDDLNRKIFEANPDIARNKDELPPTNGMNHNRPETYL